MTLSRKDLNAIDRTSICVGETLLIDDENIVCAVPCRDGDVARWWAFGAR